MDPIQPLHGLGLAPGAAPEDLLKKEHRELLHSLKSEVWLRVVRSHRAQYLFCDRLVPSTADFMRTKGRGFAEEERVLCNSFPGRLIVSAEQLGVELLGRAR
jgi:hypothetical protein